MKQSGFTLVELAIVLMIIGLLIGGVLRGQELINNARMNALTRQVMAYQGAIATFRDAYNAYPGDISNAQRRISGCTLANGCANGNGNGIVGDIDLLFQNNPQTMGTENTQFWKHLALSRIISGVNPSATNIEWGHSNPTTPLGGGFTVITTENDPLDPTGSSFNGALVLRFHAEMERAMVDESPVVSPRQAAYIDRKMDDGIPNTGGVQSFSAGIYGATGIADCEQSYNESEDRMMCIMGFLLNL